MQNKQPSLPSKFFVRNYLAGFANDPVLKIDNVGKVGSPHQEGQGDVKVKAEEASGNGEENSDENGDAVLLEKPRSVLGHGCCVIRVCLCG